jgi:hypothetical protein
MQHLHHIDEARAVGALTTPLPPRADGPRRPEPPPPRLRRAAARALAVVAARLDAETARRSVA